MSTELPNENNSSSLESLFSPVHDILLVRRDKGAEKIGSIHLTSGSPLGLSQTGVVVKAGEQASAYEGRRIVFGMYAGMSLSSPDGSTNSYLTLRPSDVLAFYDPPTEEDNQ